MLTPNHHSSTTLPSTEVAPALARRRVALACAGWPQPTLQDALLLTSELVTNAVRHGRGAIRLVIAISADVLHVEVSDENPEGLSTRHRPGPDALGGRGLFLVDSVADQWGCRPLADGSGKTVWFNLALS